MSSMLNGVRDDTSVNARSSATVGTIISSNIISRFPYPLPPPPRPLMKASKLQSAGRTLCVCGRGENAVTDRYYLRYPRCAVIVKAPGVCRGERLMTPFKPCWRSPASLSPRVICVTSHAHITLQKKRKSPSPLIPQIPMSLL